MELPVWNIQLEGRAWKGEEAMHRHDMLPGRLEMLHGKLLWSDEERGKKARRRVPVGLWLIQFFRLCWSEWQ